MKSPKTVLLLLPLLLIVLATAAINPVYGGPHDYGVSLNWRSGYNPMVFSIASLIDGDLADAGDIEFNDIEPFFDVTISNNPTNEFDRLYLWVRFVSGNNDVIFSVRSRLVDVREHLIQRMHDNRTLANDDAIDLGNGGAGVDENMALSIVDNSLIRDGFYRLIVALSTERDWNQGILGNNEGIATMSIHVQNPTQIRILQPNDGVEMRNNPMFIWRFPRQEGVTFNLDLVKGEEDQSAAEAMDSPAEANVFLSTTLTNDDFVGEGVNIFVYTGIGEQRQLDDGNYFWAVTATVPGAFPGEWFIYESPIYAFDYVTPGGGAAGGRGPGNRGGGNPFGGGGDEQDPPPREMAAIFVALQSLLPAELYQGLFNIFEDPTSWELVTINLNGQEVNLQRLVSFFLSGNRTIVMVAVS